MRLSAPRFSAKVWIPYLLLLCAASLHVIIADRSESHACDGKTSSRSRSATLATDCGFETKSHIAAGTRSRAQRLYQALATSAHMVPGLIPRDLLKCLMGCACCLILIKLCSKIDCYSKKLDCRRCRLIARFLLWCGYDEFRSFKISVTVHSVADVANKGLLGGEKQFKVKVAFRWGIFMTSATSDMKWEQTKGIEVPQGADECEITLYSEGKIKDSTLGVYTLETQRDMLDAKKFWGEKKKFKLDDKGKLVGTLSITFRNSETEDGGLGELPLDGIDEESALAITIIEAFDEMVKDMGVSENEAKYAMAQCPPHCDLNDLINMMRTGQIKKKGAPAPASSTDADGGTGAAASADADEEMPKLEGNLKIDCIARCITGALRDVSENGKDGGKTFIRVMHVNYAELQGRDLKSEMKDQMKKAQEKGLSQLPKKWYWVWYEDKKAAYREPSKGDLGWHDPDGYIPLTAISKVNRRPERNDEFVITYREDDEKKTIAYRRETGKSLDCWLDGLDLCFNECRNQVKDEKEAEMRKKGRR